MSFGYYQLAKKFTLSLFYTLSCAGLILGSLLIFIPSPESQSQTYLRQAEHYQEQANIITNQQEALAYLQHSEKAILIALSYAPYQLETWDRLNDIRQEHMVLSNLSKEQNLALSDIE